MGTYLAIGIVPKIIINKHRIRDPNLTLDLLFRELNKELKINCYNFSEDVDKYYWEIKPNMLEGNLVEFLDEQFKAYMSREDEDLKEFIAQFTNFKAFNQIMKRASNKVLVHFQLIDQIFRYIKEISINGFSEYVDVLYSLIEYFLNGKIIMECYSNLEYNIRLQRNIQSLIV